MVEYTGLPEGTRSPPTIPRRRGDIGLSRGQLALLRLLVVIVGSTALIFAAVFQSVMVMDAPFSDPEFVGIREVAPVQPWVARAAAVLWLASMAPGLSRRARLVLICASGGLLIVWAVSSVVWAIVRYKMVAA